MDLLPVTVVAEVAPLGWLLGVANSGAVGAFDELMLGWRSTVEQEVEVMSCNDAIT